MKNMNWVKMAGAAGTVLSIAATLISGWYSQKSMSEEIQRQVAEALKNQK